MDRGSSTQDLNKNSAQDLNKGSAQDMTKQDSSLGSTQVVGQIKNIDHSQNALTIDQNGKQQDLKLSGNPTVFMNGRLGSLSDLKEGQQVRAAYEERDGQKNLRWIEVTPSGKSDMQKSIPEKSGSEKSGVDKNDTSVGADQGNIDDSSVGNSNLGAPSSKSGSSDTKQGSSDKAGITAVMGTIVSVDQSKNQFVLSQGTQQWTLNLKDDSQIYQNGQLGSLTDLKEGQQVRASLDPAKKSATRIDIISSAKQDNTKSGTKSNSGAVPY